MHEFAKKLNSNKLQVNNTNAFTIVELLIVIVVIGILATISIVAYNGIQNRANESSVVSSASQTAKKLAAYQIANDQYPENLNDIGITDSNGLTYEYTADSANERQSYCATVTLGDLSYRIDSSGKSSPVKGACYNHLSGGTIPRGSNLAPPMSQWAISGSGVSFDSSTNEFRFIPGQGGSVRSPLIRVEGPRQINVRAQSYATQASSHNSPNSGVHTSISYLAADGVTSVQNNGGYTGNGHAAGTPLNSWQSYNGGFSTNSDIKYVRVTFNNSTYTSDNRIKDIEVVASD